MKEIQILLKLHSIKDFNEKLILRGEFQYYIEIFFSSTRSKSKLFRKYPQEKTNEIQINQTLSIKQYTGSQLEFWLRSESTDRVLGAFVIPFEQLTKNSEEFIEEEKNLCLSGVNFAVLDFCYQISEKNIDKPIIIERDEDLLKPPEEDKEELERKIKEKERLEREELEAQKKLLPKDSTIHLTNMYVKESPFY